MNATFRDDELRRAYDALLRTRRDAAARGAFPLEHIVDLVEGRGADDERLATLDAVMSVSAGSGCASAA